MQSPPSWKCRAELAASPRACVSHRDKEFNNSGEGDCRDVPSSLLGEREVVWAGSAVGNASAKPGRQTPLLRVLPSPSSLVWFLTKKKKEHFLNERLLLFIPVVSKGHGLGMSLAVLG